MKAQILTGMTLVCALATGCHGAARSADAYRTAVREVLDQDKTELSACYGAALDADPNAAGTVVVAFDVEPKTGMFSNAKIVEQDSTASQAVRTCVLDAVDGEELQPPDVRKGEATFTYNFHP